MNAFRIFSILAGALVLSACGGSSSNSFGEGGTPSMSITAETSEVPAKGQHFQPNPERDYTIQINVTFTAANGNPVPNGTPVTLASSSSARGVVAPADDPQATGSQATSETSGGVARFWFVSGATQGPVTLTASGTAGSGPTVTSSLQLTVIEPTDGASRLSIEGSTIMPANKEGVEIFRGSPYINELKIRYLGPDGEPGIVRLDEDSRHTAQVSISPVTRAAFSTLVDPETDFDDFTFLLGTGPVLVQGGMGTIFVHSRDVPGPVTVSATAFDIDETDDQVYSAEFVIEIIDDTADFLPAQIAFGISPDPVYIKDSGGATSKTISIDVRDSGGNPVPDPEGHGATFNNVLLELDAPQGSGARLVGTGAGGSVSGTEIRVRTINGIANFALNAGTMTGPHKITATVDRADNNVDNTLTDPLSAETTIEVGDGRLFGLELVSPSFNAIRINRVSSLVETDLQPEVDPETGLLVPPDPDGTYSLRMTVIATDQAGNPVLPGLPINFGKIDAPLTQTSPRLFVFSGNDGNPQEGGTLFSVLDPGDGFLDDPTIVDEAVEPGDTLAMFGKLVPGNREHEAARTVTSVIDNHTVRVSEPFNPNDGTGSVVDDGHVIPWVIGRSQVGVIDSMATLDANGRASVLMTYTVDQLGRPVVVWAQGHRAGGSVTKTVADVEVGVFPGIAPLLLTATPSSVAGNSIAEIRLCLTDGLGAPINHVRISGALSGGSASGTLDGQPMPTQTAATTGSDGSGCVVTELQTSNMLPDGGGATVIFFFGSAQAEVTVGAPGSGILLVNPSQVQDMTPDPQEVNLLLTLLDASGNPVPGVALTGECDGGEGTITLHTAPGNTDSSGQTGAVVLLEMSECGDGSGDGFPRTGQCTFTTATTSPAGEPIGIFTAIGIDLSQLNVSPPVCP